MFNFLKKKSRIIYIKISDDGMTLFTDDKLEWNLQWKNISKIATYKKDLLTVDLICLDLYDKSQNLTYTIDDEMTGFDQICGEIILRFPIIDKDWWSLVAHPAFKENFRLLYNNESAQHVDAPKPPATTR